ncbi:MAG: rhamnulokinase family protein [Chloroflexota bacterium]
MSSNTFLGFDFGAESGRALLGQLDDNQLHLTEVHRFANTPITIPTAAGFNLHWNILQLWSEIKEGLARSAEISQREVGGSLASVGIDTWGVDFGLLDRSGALLANPVHYRDDRTDGMMEAAFERLPKADVFAQTGIQFMQFNSLYQLLSLVINQSPLLDVADTFLTVPDLFNFWLTGRAACEFTNATTTQCYNPIEQGWAVELLNAMEIPSSIFPEIVTPGTVLGEVRTGLASELGIEALPVVAPACHDTGSAVAAVPAQGHDFVWLSSGTWSILGIEVQEAVVNEQALAYNLTNEGGVNGTFRLCKNVMGMWIVQECRRTWSQQGHDYSYDVMAKMATEAAPFQALIDPDADDFLKPGDMPSRIQSYCQQTGQSGPATHGAMIRCVLESLALKYRLVLERLEALTDRQLGPIHIMGGGSQNRLLNQFTADATGRPVITGPVEATATGNILIQAIAMGQLGSLGEGRAMLRSSIDLGHYEPELAAKDAWDEAYSRIQALVSKT